MSKSVYVSDLHDIEITPDLIKASVWRFKSGKQHGKHLSSDRIIYASSPLEQFLAPFFTACFHHGQIPLVFRDAIVQPIPKKE